VRVVSAEEIRRVLTFPVLIAAMEQGHRRPRVEIRDELMGTETALYFVRSAADHGRVFGSKLITSFPGNLAPGGAARGGLPAVQGLYVLFDGTDGRPLAVLDGTEITWWKTAADSALGATLLAPANPGTLLVVGAGAMAPWLVRAHRSARPSIRRVLAWNRTPERAVRLAADLRREDVEATAVAELEAAVGEAEVITTVTRSHAPLIRGDWLRPGVHLDLVGGYTPQTREADDTAARRARIFVDRRESARDVGDIHGPIASGAIRTEDVLGDLYDLIGGGLPGRLAPTDITLFKNAGGGHLDLMTAQAILAQLDAAPSGPAIAGARADRLA
jgi:ornithine cyclodeaminase/alanine dehydrogenase-like protein (mu-crystallin family)